MPRGEDATRIVEFWMSVLIFLTDESRFLKAALTFGGAVLITDDHLLYVAASTL